MRAGRTETRCYVFRKRFPSHTSMLRIVGGNHNLPTTFLFATHQFFQATDPAHRLTPAQASASPGGANSTGYPNASMTSRNRGTRDLPTLGGFRAFSNRLTVAESLLKDAPKFIGHATACHFTVFVMVNLIVVKKAHEGRGQAIVGNAEDDSGDMGLIGEGVLRPTVGNDKDMTEAVGKDLDLIVPEQFLRGVKGLDDHRHTAIAHDNDTRSAEINGCGVVLRVFGYGKKIIQFLHHR